MSDLWRARSPLVGAAVFQFVAGLVAFAALDVVLVVDWVGREGWGWRTLSFWFVGAVLLGVLVFGMAARRMVTRRPGDVAFGAGLLAGWVAATVLSGGAWTGLPLWWLLDAPFAPTGL